MAVAEISPSSLLRELDDAWIQLGKGSGEGESTPVLRSCAMTLIVATEEDTASVAETLAQLMQAHPSRSIVLNLRSGTGDELSAGVVPDCWMPFGGRQQICCERIEMNATRSTFSQLPPVLRGLIVPDLPVVLWCRSRSMASEPPFSEVLSLAGKIVVDSADTTDVADQIAWIHSLRRDEHVVADLAWTRLTRWREAIAQIFDDPDALRRLPGIDSVSIEHEGGGMPISGAYLMAWLENCLGRPLRRSILERPGGDRPRVRHVALTGGDICYSVTVGSDRCAAVHGEVRDAHSLFPRLSDYELLREELFIPGVDRVYDAAVERALQAL